MFKFSFVVLALSFSTLASAKTLSYQVDFDSTSGMDNSALEICGYPEKFSVDAALPIGPELIKQLFTADAKISLQEIQSTSGTLSGGNRAEQFTGAYREKVYLVKQVVKGIYNPGIYTRVQVNTYGSTLAPSGIIISSELLNHRYSAELAEGADCGEIWYRLN